MILAGKDKASVTEYFMSTGSMPDTTAQAGINTNAGQSEWLSEITWTTGATGATLNYTIADSIESTGKQIIFVGSFSDATGMTWICTDSTLASKYLPANCR